jgi:hypothetical protein
VSAWALSTLQCEPTIRHPASTIAVTGGMPARASPRVPGRLDSSIAVAQVHKLQLVSTDYRPPNPPAVPSSAAPHPAASDAEEDKHAAAPGALSAGSEAQPSNDEDAAGQGEAAGASSAPDHAQDGSNTSADGKPAGTAGGGSSSGSGSGTTPAAPSAAATPLAPAPAPAASGAPASSTGVDGAMPSSSAAAGVAGGGAKPGGRAGMKGSNVTSLSAGQSRKPASQCALCCTACTETPPLDFRDQAVEGVCIRGEMPQALMGTCQCGCCLTLPRIFCSAPVQTGGSLGTACALYGNNVLLGCMPLSNLRHRQRARGMLPVNRDHKPCVWVKQTLANAAGGDSITHGTLLRCLGAR